MSHEMEFTFTTVAFGALIFDDDVEDIGLEVEVYVDTDNISLTATTPKEIKRGGRVQIRDTEEIIEAARAIRERFIQLQVDADDA